MSYLTPIVSLPQELSPPPREGLPYWLFWLLVCVILLLVATIFLRDKELRLRIDAFFLQTKKRMIKIRLKMKLKKVVRRKEELLMELGRSAYRHRVPVPRGENIHSELTKLERELLRLQQERNEKESHITGLRTEVGQAQQSRDAQIKEETRKNAELQEKVLILKEQEKKSEIGILQQQNLLVEAAQRLNRLRKELLDLSENPTLSKDDRRTQHGRIDDSMRRTQSEKEAINLEIHGLLAEKLKLADDIAREHQSLTERQKSSRINEDEFQRRIREFHKEIKEWEKSSERLREKAANLEKKQLPLFESLGMLIEKERIESHELAVYYSRIDRANTRISDIKQQIKALT